MAYGYDHWRCFSFSNFTASVMKKVKYLFLVCTALFLTGRIMVLLEIHQSSWLKNYLNDLLCMPIILTICLIGVQFIKNDKTIRISLFSALSLATFYSLYFEVILPLIMERYTADIYDVFLYFTGALVFYLLQEPTHVKERALKKKKAANRQPF